MENSEIRKQPLSGGSTASAVKSREVKAPRPAASANGAKDGVAAYVENNMDIESLTGDIKTLVTEKLQSTIPDEQRLMMELVNKVGELTDEVRQLRKQLDSKPYAVFTCPSTQMRDMTTELSEIKLLLEKEPLHREQSAAMLQPAAAQPARPAAAAERPVQAVPAEPAPPGTVQRSAGSAAVQTAPYPPPAKKKKSGWSVAGNLFFYVMIFALVIGAFLYKSGSGGQPTMVAGYSAFTVLTSSMEDVYPKGSLIVTKRVEPEELKVGDDITYMISETSSVTHRIVGIMENYQDTGERAFETKGTRNEKADKDPVSAVNVVGKVIFCSKPMGAAANFVSANWPILLFSMAVLGGLVAFLKWNFRSEDAPDKKAKQYQHQTA